MTQFFPIITIITFLLIGLRTKQFGIVRKYNVSFEAFILTFVFFIGSLTALGIPTSSIKWVNEILILFFFVKKINNSRSKYPLFGLFLILTFILVFSALLNDSLLTPSFFYYRFYLSPFLFFWGIYNSKYMDVQWRKLTDYLFFLFAFQIVAQFIKVLLWKRFVENPVGSITIAGGGVATYIPLVLLGFLFSYYFTVKSSKKIWYWAIGFAFIGISSQKRAAFYFIPILAIFFIIIYWKTNKTLPFLKGIRLLLIVLSASFFIFYLNAKYSFVTKKVGGEISLELFIEHAEKYLNTKQGDLALGRFSSFSRTLNIVKESNLTVNLLGFGPSSIKGFSRGDGLLEKFGFGGTFPGWTYQYIQLGLLGCFFYILIYLVLLKKIYKITKSEFDPYWKAIGIGTMIYILFVFIDFIIYSMTLFTIYSFTYSLFFLIAIMLKRRRVWSEKVRK